MLSFVDTMNIIFFFYRYPGKTAQLQNHGIPMEIKFSYF